MNRKANNFDEVMSLIKKEIYSIRDIDVCKVLEIKPNNYWMKKISDSIPYKEVVSFCAKKGISLDYILTKEAK